MSRYIDADKALKDADTIDPKYAKLIEQVKNIIKAQPTADVIEIVRCKDCKHRHYDKERDFYYCEMYYGMGCVADNNYCCYGKRKEGDNECK